MAATPLGSGRSADVVAEADGQVVKLFPAGTEEWLVRREFEAHRLAHQVGVPTPAPRAVVERDGRQALVMERADGLPMLAWFRTNPFGAMAAFVTLGELHARMHAHDAPSLPPQKDFIARHIVAARLPAEVERAVLRRLSELPAATRLCHGDVHPGNVMWSRQGARFVDWGTACGGAPHGDVARTLLLLGLARLPPGLGFLAPFRRLAQQLYLHGYRRAAPLDRQALRAWWLPVAAARLAGENRHERQVLLPMIERACR